MGLLSETLIGETQKDYLVRKDTPHQIRIARRLQPIREVILNFAGEDLFVHCEEGEQSKGLPLELRVNEDGTLLELRTNSPVTMDQIAFRVREFLAAVKSVKHTLLFSQVPRSADLAAITAFYSSPVGQKILKEMPAIMSESMQAGGEIGRRAFEAKSHQLDQGIAELVKETKRN